MAATVTSTAGAEAFAATLPLDTFFCEETAACARMAAGSLVALVEAVRPFPFP